MEGDIQQNKKKFLPLLFILVLIVVLGAVYFIHFFENNQTGEVIFIEEVVSPSATEKEVITTNTGPRIYDVASTVGKDLSDFYIVSDRGIVYWKTDVPADSQVEYSLLTWNNNGLLEPYTMNPSKVQQTPLNSTLTTYHKVRVFSDESLPLNLFFRVKSRDSSGNLAVSPVNLYMRNRIDPMVGERKFLVVYDSITKSAATSIYPQLMAFWAKNSYYKFNPQLDFIEVPVGLDIPLVLWQPCSLKWVITEYLPSIGVNISKYNYIFVELSHDKYGNECRNAWAYYQGAYTVFHENSHRLGLHDNCNLYACNGPKSVCFWYQKGQEDCYAEPDCYVSKHAAPCHSIMGNNYEGIKPSEYPDFLLAEKESLGWINNPFDPTLYPTAPIVNTSGVYTINVLEDLNTEQKGIKILRDFNPRTGNKGYYYFEIRKNSPGVVYVFYYTPFNPSLPLGELPKVYFYGAFGLSRDLNPSFVDPWRGINVTLLSWSNNYATLQVSFTPITTIVNKTGRGNGVVTTLDGKINCGATCSAKYYNGEITIFRAVPDNDSYIENIAAWSGCDYKFYNASGFFCNLGIDYDGISPTIRFDSVYPLPVSGLVANVVSNTKVNLQWNSSPDATSYNIYRSVGTQDNWVFLSNTTKSDTYYSDTNSIVPGTTYYYKVRAVKSVKNKESDDSNIISVTIPLTASTTYTLNVNKLGGNGQIIADIPALMCGNGCSSDYNSGQNVNLKYLPNSNNKEYLFWQGCDSIGADSFSCNLVMNSNRTVIFNASKPIMFFHLSNISNVKLSTNSTIIVPIDVIYDSGLSNKVSFNVGFSFADGASISNKLMNLNGMSWSNPISCTPNCTTFLQLNASANAQHVNYSTTVYANDGVTTVKKSFNLTVGNFQAGEFDFSLNNEGTKKVVRGSSIQQSVSAILLKGIPQPIDFYVVGLPDGVEATFSPSRCDSIQYCTTKLIIQVPETTQIGSYDVIVIGRTANLTKITSFTLNVVNPDGQTEYLVSVRVTGAGTTISDPPGIYCGGEGNVCSVTYPFATTVKLIPFGPNMDKLTSWSGCDFVNGTTCFLYMNNSKSVIANFNSTGEQVPSAPTKLAATVLSTSQIKLRWRDNSKNELGFKIYRNNALVGRVGSNEVTYVDIGLNQKTTYSYYVVAYNSEGESNPSNLVSVTTKSSR